MTTFLQVLLTGLGLGSAYALFAQGVVLIYRGSGIVNFAQGALGMLASYITFLELRDNARPGDRVCIAGWDPQLRCWSRCSFQYFVLRLLANAAPIVRLISTLGLLVVVQSASSCATAGSNHPVAPYLPHDTFDWGGVIVQEQVLYIIGITLVVTVLLWAFAKYQPHRPRDHRRRAERAGGADDGLVAEQARRRSRGAWARRSPGSPACCSPRSPACRRSRSRSS